MLIILAHTSPEVGVSHHCLVWLAIASSLCITSDRELSGSGLRGNLTVTWKHLLDWQDAGKSSGIEMRQIAMQDMNTM